VFALCDVGPVSSLSSDFGEVDVIPGSKTTGSVVVANRWLVTRLSYVEIVLGPLVFPAALAGSSAPGWLPLELAEDVLVGTKEPVPSPDAPTGTALPADNAIGGKRTESVSCGAMTVVSPPLWEVTNSDELSVGELVEIADPSGTREVSAPVWLCCPDVTLMTAPEAATPDSGRVEDCVWDIRPPMADSMIEPMLVIVEGTVITIVTTGS
jgi:hypothetical protein